MGDSYRSPVERLLARGDPRGLREWPDYVGEHGLSAVDVPELIRMALDEELNRSDSESAEVWAPLHAWRALGQLRAVEAAEPLLGLFQRIHDDHDDWVREELPEVYGMLGAPGIPLLIAYVADRSHGLFSRVAAASALEKIGIQHPQAREEVISHLTRQLEQGGGEDPTLNGFLVSNLIDLKAVESLPAIREAYRSGQVDISICGDFQEVEIAMGVRGQRTAPPSRPFLSGLLPIPEANTPPDWSRAGRNDLCPCGSGLKFKKCCLKKVKPAA